MPLRPSRRTLRFAWILTFPFLGVGGAGAQTSSIPPETGEAARRLIQAALESPVTWERLGALVDTYGSRPSGSEALEGALDWILEKMEADGLENVRSEPVLVPHWVRGDIHYIIIIKPITYILMCQNTEKNDSQI